VRERFGFYHASIFIVEETGFTATLQEATGDAGAEMKLQKHSLRIGSNSVVGQVTQMGMPIIVNDTGTNPLHKFNPLLPDTRAEAAIPLRIGNRTIGALDIQSTQKDAFSDDDIAVLQTLSDQVAIAIDNARSYELSMEAMKEMREIDRLKTTFLANMSHELRTPLNSIIGFSRVILKGIDGPITDLQQSDLSAIYNSGQHLLGLINDILDVSKIEAGKMELAFEEVNLSDVISSVMSTAMGLIKDKPIRLVKNVPADLPHAHADSIRVRQVLINLFSNASKFTDEGSITVEAHVVNGTSGKPEIYVGVTDTGPGIAEKDQVKLFQPFSQVDDAPTRKTGGSGLGLSISQRLIRMHGGEIGLKSQVGEGTTFFFTLPVYQEPKPVESGSRVILAIDDDPQVISLYERYLKSSGYQVVPLSDPSQAAKRVAELKPFAVTLDIMMPGVDGWQVLTELKSNPETRDIPVMICSIIEEQERGFNLGASDYLVKPILEEDLVQALNRINGDGAIHEVLVIDDNSNDLSLMGKMLTDNGLYKPLLAQGGAKGWEMILNQRPQAVILDLFMPDMDGFNILEKMRTNKGLSEIPIIVVSSGDLTPEQRQQLTDFGQQFISKSNLSDKDLIANLEKALQRVKAASS
jgi:signal transduction histidine kinase/CheY-like chemotaxis protein